MAVEEPARQTRWKIFNDPIHGTIRVHNLAVAIMDTPEFQRLRHIYQLGGAHYVYPSAAHSRFEHSVGVYHLAGQLVKMLKEQQPELEIDDSDVLCVQLAGLTHDLGHGPFSHIFHQEIVPRLGTDWKPEKGAIDMLDHIYAKHEIQDGFRQWGMDERDLNFIKSLIICDRKMAATGRGKDKIFLYDIVANGRNGIDVDKWDYLVRDCYRLGITCGFNSVRMMYQMKVMEIKGVPQICVRDKGANDIHSMFHATFELHKKAYQHKVVLMIDLMIAEALYKASDHLRFSGKTMKECLDDMEAFTRLHDGVFHKILDSDGPELHESRELLNRLQTRKLWKFIGQATLSLGIDEDGRQTIKKRVVQQLEDENRQIKLQYCTINFGPEGHDPFDSLMFYSKRSPHQATTLKCAQKLSVLPKEFQQKWLRAYYTGNEERTPEEVTAAVRECFKEEKLDFIDH